MSASSETRKTQVHFVSGRPGPARGEALSSLVRGLPGQAAVVLVLEGAPTDGSAESDLLLGLPVHRLAPGCPCCIGNLTLRVTLARILRAAAPDHMVIALIEPEHVPNLCRLLSAAPWDVRLQCPDCR